MKRQGIEMLLNSNNKDRLQGFITKTNRHAWVGMSSSFNMDNIDMESCKNFRLSHELHQKYEAVWLYEKRLDHYHILSWKIIIDEAIRLLGVNGFLVIRLQENKDFTIPMVKSFLGRNINLKTDIELEYVNENAECVIIFKIERLNIDKYNNNRWTFAMLTIGKKDENVLKFLESIRVNDKENKHEIIISGPKKEIYDKFNVKYIDISKFRDEEYAEISKKKNAIAGIASNPNLLIAHDRYYLSKTFFSDFEKYGYDFDFLVIRQIFEDGTEFPSYTFSYEPDLTKTHPVLCRNYQYLFRRQYVNGGIMVFKTHNLRAIPFNNLLFWDQMEDVEITQTFINNSLIPRVNFINTAYAVNDKSDRSRCFMLFDVFDGERIYEKVANMPRSKVHGINTIPIKTFL
jgi:hypothetical protein